MSRGGAPRLVPGSVTVRAPAKINLHLGVGAPRPDGFHPLATVYQAIGVYDDVTATASATWGCEVHADAHVSPALLPHPEDNLAVQAGRLLASHHGVDLAVHLSVRKSIPVAGGMAGGSADAAAALVAVDRLWGCHTSDADMLALAAQLGSDVPFALLGGTALGTGRGEVVEPVSDLGTWWWVAVLSEEGLSTPSVYGRFDDLGCGDSEPTDPGAVLAALETGGPDRLAAVVHNDLEIPALELRPDLREVLERGDEAGALAVMLSGSGPTCLMLCADHQHARSVRQAYLDQVEGAPPRLLAAPGPVPGAHVVEYV